MRVLAFFLLLAASTISAQPADFQFSLSTASAVAGAEVNLRIDSDTNCYPANTFEVVRNGSTVTVSNTLSDTSPCAPDWQTPRFVNLGAFDAGQYEVVVVTCVNAPVNPCSTWATLPLTIYGGSRHVVVPALSTLTMIGLLVIVAGVGLLARRSI